MPAITVADFDAIREEDLPWAHGMRTRAIGDGTAVLELAYTDDMVRPGGTVPGPFMMALADATMYAAVLSVIGEVKLAVTTSLNINFLFRPRPGGLVAEGRVLKAGKRLVVVEVTVHSDGHDKPVAHATGTYSIPPRAD